MSQSPLKNKQFVLYVMKNDQNSLYASNFANSLPDIFVQQVEDLPRVKIPDWLDSVPTIVPLKQPLKIDDILKGTDALQFLSNRHSQYINAMARYQQQQQQQQQPHQQPLQQPLQQQQRPLPPQTQTIQHTTTYPPFPPQQQQQQQQQYPSQHHPVNPNRLPNQIQPRRPDSVGRIEDQLPQNQSGTDTTISSSLNPASGTGSYGCSLDGAFTSFEETNIVDPRYNDQASGSVGEGERMAYMKMREGGGGGGGSMMRQ